MLNTTPTARRRAGLAAAAVVAGLAATLGLAAAAGAQTIPLLTFEADEGVGANAGGGVYGPFGATQGVRAFDFNNLASGNRTLFDIGTVNGDAPAGSPQLDNYEAFNSLNTALNSGKNGLLEFDLTIDDAGVMGPDATTSGEGFLQLGVFINSDAGFKGLGFGDLLGGNIGGVGTFPELGNAAVAGGVTLTILDPVNDAAGDTTFTARVSIPVGPNRILSFGDGGDGSLDFAQFGFTQNSGYGGTINLAIDNVVLQVPEPTSLGLLGLAAAPLLMRRRRR